MEFKIGCTGWSYEGWSGTFYPKGMAPGARLKYYSKIFETTEIITTSYDIPNPYLTKRWLLQTPKDFKFSAKFPSIITHEHKLKNVKSFVIEFLLSMVPLKPKIDALVLQLPPTLEFEEAKPRLDELYRYLPDYYKFPVEGRHKSWFTDEAVDYLTEKNICLVWNEITGCDNPGPITSDLVYLRLIGDRSISDFGKVVRNQEKTIQKWVDRIKKVEKQVSFGIFMANNHFEGFAAETANKLRKCFGQEELIWEEKKQQKLG